MAEDIDKLLLLLSSQPETMALAVGDLTPGQGLGVAYTGRDLYNSADEGTRCRCDRLAGRAAALYAGGKKRMRKRRSRKRRSRKRRSRKR